MKIFASVVTYNRLPLLKECIDRLRKQTRKPDKIIVINNGSTDNTLDWLQAQNDLMIVNQENSGSSGGQYTAVKTAYEQGADYVWLMDDDCMPEPDALEQLLTFLEKHQLHGKAVVTCVPHSNQEDDKVCFPISEYPSKRTYFRPSEINNQEAIRSLFFGFLGVLLPKEAIQKTGYPNPHYFIRCDDAEYALRLKKINFPIYIVTKAIVRHPSPKHLQKKILWIDLTFPIDDYHKMFYDLRNSIHTLKKHAHPLAFIGKYLPKYLLIATYKAMKIDKSPKNLWIYLKAIFHGLTNRLGKVDIK
jgi:GT2 family glycosyltransferase